MRATVRRETLSLSANSSKLKFGSLRTFSSNNSSSSNSLVPSSLQLGLFCTLGHGQSLKTGAKA
jgi:hypothetical protein